jgi:bacteriorhodopsin
MYWITGILGLFLIIAPFVLGYSVDVTAMWSSIILGLIVIVLSAIKGFAHDMAAKWEYWLVAIMGVLAVVAPFVLNFRAQARPLEASVILGAVMIVVAAYQLISSPQTQ